MATERKSIGTGEKVIIRPSSCSTLVKKTDSIGYVPHEPVKGAVVRQPQVSTAPTGHFSNIIGQQTGHWEMKSVTSVMPGHIELYQATPPRDDRLPADGSDASIGIREPCLGNSSPLSGVTNQSNLTSGLISTTIDAERRAELSCPSATSSQSDGWLDQTVALLKPASPGRELENCEAMRRLEVEVVTLREQLVIQTKVNTDLKKLLVASIGDDLHHKVDALVRTKIQLANEIDDYTKKLLEDYEDLDKMSIQADIWHSKYKASRVLVEQLTSERDRMSASISGLRAALTHLVDEQHNVRQLLLLTNRNLESLQANTLLSTTDSVALRPKRHCVELAMSNKHLTDAMCLSVFKMLPSHSPSVSSCCTLSPAEAIALQVLNEPAVVEAETLYSSVACPRSTLQPRFQPLTRSSGVTYNCCARCKGEVHLL
jgi:hypothetical protein